MAAANGTGTAAMQRRAVSTASRLLGSVEMNLLSLKEKKSEDPIAKRLLM